MLARLAFLLPVVLAVPATALGLSFVESSQGLIPPTMEGGNTEVEFCDVNEDGRLDLVSIGDHGSPYINSDQHGIMIWFGDGAGGWSVHMNGNFGYGGVALGDLNGDGDIDAAYGMHHNYSGTDFGDQLLEAALGDGTGRNWIPWDDGLATSGEDWGMFGTDLADFDNDGDLDIVSLSFGCCAGVHVYANHGDGTWAQTFGFTGGNAGEGLYCGDINADGFQDFVVAHQSATVYLGDGTGSFTVGDGNLPGAGSIRTGVSLGDIDNDGDLDIAFRPSNASLQVWKWDPSGAWIDASAGLPTSGIAATQLADMDGDGWCDVIGLGNGILRVWLGNGGSSWSLTATINLPSPGNFQALRAGGDVDHNGRGDIAVVTEQGSWPSYVNRFRVFRESTAAVDLAARFVSPTGGERMAGGSARFIDWIAAVPAGETATVDLDLSLSGPAGPWTPVAQAIPCSDRYQWALPVVPSTDQAHLRLRVTSESGSVETITPRAFSIFPPTSAAIEEEIAEAARLFVVPNPSAGLVRLEGFRDAAQRIEIVDAAGRVVRSLGHGACTWDGRDDGGRRVPAGAYFARSAAGRAPLIRIR